MFTVLTNPLRTVLIFILRVRPGCFFCSIQLVLGEHFVRFAKKTVQQCLKCFNFTKKTLIKIKLWYLDYGASEFARLSVLFERKIKSPAGPSINALHDGMLRSLTLFRFPLTFRQIILFRLSTGILCNHREKACFEYSK